MVLDGFMPAAGAAGGKSAPPARFCFENTSLLTNFLAFVLTV
jgi:hypothetical protein